MAARAAALLAAACLARALGAAPEVPDAEAPVAAHAARGALAALADVDEAEAALVAAEQAAIASGAAGPLEAFAPVHDAVGLLLDALLGGLRHTLAAGAAAEGERQQILALERQAGGLLTAQVKEPLFFWHGPKWLLLSKFRGVLGGAGSSGEPALLDRLRALSSRHPAGAVTVQQLVGGAGSSAGGVEELSETAASGGTVPALGVAVGNPECGPAAAGSPLPACAVVGPLAEAARASGGGSAAVHLLVLPCSKPALERLGAVLKERHSELPPLFVSLAVSREAGEAGAHAVRASLKDSLGALGRVSLDLLWLPYGAFKKRQWQEVKSFLEQLMNKSIIGAYGVFAEARSTVLAKKLLDREPKPAAWLKQHDLLRPSEPEAVATARGLGIRVVALPRRPGVPSTLAGAYLEAAAGKDAMQEAVQLRWTLQQGLAATVRLGAAAAPSAGAALQQLAETRLASGAAQLLAALGALCSPEPRKLIGSSLEGALERSRTTTDNAAADQLPPAPPAVPSVNGASLEGLPAQHEQYKANNHVIYREDFFDADTWAAIKAETQRLWRSEDIEANCNLDGVNRLGGYVLDHNPRGSSLYRLIYGNEAFRRWVSAVNGEGEMWPSDFPIELREYGPQSGGMACHPDLQMYAVPRKDLEFAVTVDNDSSCNVTYRDAKGVVHKVRTHANSVMMVRVNAAEHCVSPTNGGTRTILKFIFVGDYRKSAHFWSYTGNVCGEDNRNRQMLRQRREAGATAAEGGLEL
uniref:Fe2OG dioxygenase domain-containing protein n=1 Tax=Alexandrium monilatum TaxID=311494 RepID=A0A7S4PX75_9DINO